MTLVSALAIVWRAAARSAAASAAVRPCGRAAAGRQLGQLGLLKLEVQLRLAQRQLELGAVEAREHLTRGHLVAGLDLNRHDLAGDPEREVRGLLSRSRAGEVDRGRELPGRYLDALRRDYHVGFAGLHGEEGDHGRGHHAGRAGEDEPAPS